MRNSECGIDEKGHSLPEASTDIPHSALRIPHLLAGALVLALMPPPAGAQQPDTTRQDTTPSFTLPPIEVRASIIPTAGPTVGSSVPARIATVTGREIDAWEPRLLADALASQAGVSLYDDLGSPYKLNLSTRGFTAGPTVGLPPGVSVFLDGVRQNEPDAQEVNFDLLPMEHVKRVELLSGSASLLGPNSLGGAVNLITRRGGGPLTGELEASGGSFGSASGEGSVSGRSHGGWDYYLGGGYEREDGWRGATGAENYNAFANLDRLGSTRGLQFQAFGARSRAATAGSLPETIFDVTPQVNFTPGDFENLNAEQVALSGYAPFRARRASFTTYFRHSGAERFNVNQAPDDDVRAFTTNNTVGGSGDWRWTAPAGALSLRVGIDGGANRVHVRIFGEPQDGSPATLTTDVKSPSLALAAYALADARSGRATVSLGARYDYVRIPFRNLLDPSSDTTSTFRRLSPRGGASVDLGRGASLYASVGQSFRAPAILELACADPTATCPLPFALGEDPTLKPVTATTYEVGGRWARGPAVVSASVYRSEVRDEIFFVASASALLSGFFTNISRTRRAGAELSAQVSFGDRLFGYANYAYTHATFRTAAELFSIRSDSAFVGSPLAGPNDVASGDRLPLVPEHQVKAGILVRPAGGLELGLNGRMVGRQWLRGDEANETASLDAYLVTDARIGYDVGSWEITGIVTNLFDSRRAVFGTFNENRQTGELERFLTPLNARAFKVIVRRAFGVGAAGDDH
jgi:iron complex outermembrane receptor protein